MTDFGMNLVFSYQLKGFCGISSDTRFVGFNSLEQCGDLSPLWPAALGAAAARNSGDEGCDRSQTTKAVTGHRTPKS